MCVRVERAILHNREEVFLEAREHTAPTPHPPPAGHLLCAHCFNSLFDFLQPWFSVTNLTHTHTVLILKQRIVQTIKIVCMVLQLMNLKY